MASILSTSVATRVLVLGHSGMLGRIVLERLHEEGFDALTIRSKFNIAEGEYIRDVASANADVVINCAARISAVAPDLFAVNTLMPLLVAATLEQGQLLIHASTDGVFSGHAGPYSVCAAADASDRYGLSKRLAERCLGFGNVICIRSSIIDITGGLLGWLAQQSGVVQGFEDHLWNGVTTLDWADFCIDLIHGRISRNPAIRHLTCAHPVSKYELLRQASEAFRLPARVLPALSGTTINRTLLPTDSRSDVSDMLESLRYRRSAGLARARNMCD